MAKRKYDEPSAMQQRRRRESVEAAMIMPDSPRWTPWFAFRLAVPHYDYSRKHFTINGRSGWRNNMAFRRYRR